MPSNAPSDRRTRSSANHSGASKSKATGRDSSSTTKGKGRSSPAPTPNVPAVKTARVSPEGSAAIAESNKARAVYDPEVFMPAILERLAMGEGLATICRDEGYPSRGAVIDWSARPEWSDRYARAREAGIEAQVDRITEIADTEPDPNRARVMIDARKWIASKLLPKRYGDRLEVETKIDLFAQAVAQSFHGTKREADTLPVLPEN